MRVRNVTCPPNIRVRPESERAVCANFPFHSGQIFLVAAHCAVSIRPLKAKSLHCRGARRSNLLQVTVWCRVPGHNSVSPTINYPPAAICNPAPVREEIRVRHSYELVTKDLSFLTEELIKDRLCAPKRLQTQARAGSGSHGPRFGRPRGCLNSGYLGADADIGCIHHQTRCGFAA